MGTHPIFESDFDCPTDKKYGPRKYLVLAQRKEYLRQRSPPLPRSRWPRRRSHQEVRLEHVPSGFPGERSTYWIQETRLNHPILSIGTNSSSENEFNDYTLHFLTSVLT